MCQDPNNVFFSLRPDPDQTKGYKLIVGIGTKGSVVAHCHDIRVSRQTQFCPLPHQNFERHAKDPARIPEHWIQDPKWFLVFRMGFEPFHQTKTLS